MMRLRTAAVVLGLAAVVVLGWGLLVAPSAAGQPGPEPARGAAAAPQPAPAALPPALAGGAQPSYLIDVLVVQPSADGLDLEADGKGKILSQPRLVTLEGQEAQIQVGGQVPIRGDQAGQITYLPFGLTLRVKVVGLGEGRFRLEATQEHVTPDRQDETFTQVSGTILRVVAVGQLGEPLKFEPPKGRGPTCPRVTVRVTMADAAQIQRPAVRAPEPAAPPRPE
jgi:Flp pilus assembly secretin CpaC